MISGSDDRKIRGAKAVHVFLSVPWRGPDRVGTNIAFSHFLII